LIFQTALRGGLCASRSAISATSTLGTWRLHIPFIGAHSPDHRDIKLDERRLGGIRGAKKKAAGSTTNGRESPGRRLGIKVWCDKFARTLVDLLSVLVGTDESALISRFLFFLFFQAREISLYGNGVNFFVPVRMLVWAKITRYLQKQMALCT
jgi:Ribosomal L27 protein